VGVLTHALTCLHMSAPSASLPCPQQDTTGLGVILLTFLTEEQWVEEDDVARRLNLPNKMVRKALRYLEQVCGVLVVGACLPGSGCD
jgi:hypothetical protein